MKHIGEISVDSGQIKLADPCYKDGEGMTLTINTPMGDGIYHIFEMYDDEGKVVSLLVDLDPYGLAKWNDEEEK